MTHDLEDRLRNAFAYRSVRTEIRSNDSSLDDRPDEPRRFLPALAALTAAAVLVVGGLVVVTSLRSAPSSPTVPVASLPQANLTPIDVTADELSLDDWIGSAATDTPAPSWTVLDVTSLPEGVELISEVGNTLLGLPLDTTTQETGSGRATHIYQAQLRDGNDATFDVAVTSSQVGPCTALIEPGPDNAAAGVDINGVDAAVSGSLVCWMARPGLVASVEVVGASSPTDADASIDLARQIKFTDVEQLPKPSDAVESGGGPSSAEFSGTLSGVPWAATVSPSSLRTMTTYIDGRMSASFENDRLSQPTDTAAGAGELSLDAVAGKGAIVYGYSAPEIVAVRVVNNNAESLVLETFPRELETFFAVPIPDSITIDTLEFLRADGSTYATATIGPLPKDLAGSYGGIFSILRSPAPDD